VHHIEISGIIRILVNAIRNDWQGANVHRLASDGFGYVICML
jgi:hypothetical protein